MLPSFDQLNDEDGGTLMVEEAKYNEMARVGNGEELEPKVMHNISNYLMSCFLNMFCILHQDAECFVDIIMNASIFLRSSSYYLRQPLHDHIQSTIKLNILIVPSTIVRNTHEIIRYSSYFSITCQWISNAYSRLMEEYLEIIG